MTAGVDRAVSIDARLLDAAPRVRAGLVASVGATLVATAVVIAQAYLMAGVVAAVFIEGRSFAAILVPLGIVAALAIARVPCLWAADAFAQRAALRLTDRMRQDLTGRLLDLGPAYVGRERSGELVGVVVDGLADLDSFVATYMPTRWLAGAGPILVIAAVLLLDPPSALVLIVTGPVLVLLLATIGSRAGAVTARRFAERRWLGAYFLDVLQGIATLRAFGRSAEQVDTIRVMSRRYGNSTMEVLRTAFQTSLVLEWGGAVAVALVAVEVSLRLIDASIPFERALAVLIIVPEFFLPLRQLAGRYHAGGAGRAVAVRAFAILDTMPAAPSSVPHAVNAAAGDEMRGALAPAPATGGEIRFDAVTVSYAGRVVPALDSLDLVIPARGSLALVGETGAGKTTVANLLLRFIEPDLGTITVDGVPIATVDPARWRRDVAWVPQRPHLFHGTVAENIAMARPDSDAASVRQAAEAAGADAFVRRLPQGYDTPVGEGGIRLSGGERQRIAIARAFLADAPLVILDEATSHLDPASERSIRDAIGVLARGRTLIVISHRLRLVSMVDRVAVLVRGGIAEVGPPSDLLTHDGPYRRLVETQAAEDPT